MGRGDVQGAGRVRWMRSEAERVKERGGRGTTAGDEVKRREETRNRI